MIKQQDNPFNIFNNWLNEAKSHKDIIEPTAMSLATASKDGKPNVRIVLLKGHDERGFCFFGNLGSPKFQDIQENPAVALDFYWMPLGRQIRIRGIAEALTKEEADDYFATRHRNSQISAWASKQSQSLNDYQEFDTALKQIEERFQGQEIPRPEFWSGYRLVPDEIEFWFNGEFRRHERYLFKRKNNSWNLTLLYP